MYRQHVSLTAVLFLFLAVSLLNSPHAAATQPGSNGRIAFHSTTTAGSNEIFTIGADGSSPTQLTNNTDGDGPHYSADGQKILFTIGLQVYTMNADGSSQVNLSNNSSLNYRDTYGTYSPDGTKIVFQSLRDGASWNIYMMAADGSSQTLLTTQGGSNDLPAWSPDGTQIVYRHIDPDGYDGQQDLWILNADGTDAHAITTGDADDEHPSWAPDGSRITFMSKGRETNGDVDYEIYTIRPDGTDIRQLTFNADYDSNPNWAPDGARIAFNTLIAGAFDIYTMDLVGGSVVNVTKTPTVNEYDPDWQPLAVPPTVTGFFDPVDMGVTNSGKAGQSIPVKWRLLDGRGVPVADPASFVSLTSTATPGGCGGSVDAIETYAGTSGLQYLGDGYWQYNWKTPRDYAGQCRTMVLELKGNLKMQVNFSFK